jgi:hypothetical protein
MVTYLQGPFLLPPGRIEAWRQILCGQSAQQGMPSAFNTPMASEKNAKGVAAIDTISAQRVSLVTKKGTFRHICYVSGFRFVNLNFYRHARHFPA